MRRPPRIFAAIVLLVAIAFLYGGALLIAVGGSFYYVLAGLALLASAILLWRGSKLGSVMLSGTEAESSCSTVAGS